MLLLGIRRVSEISHINELRRGISGMEHLTTEFYEISREPNPDCISLDSIHKRVLKRQGILMNRYVFIGHKKLIKVSNEKNPLSISTWFLTFSSLKFRVWWIGFFFSSLNWIVTACVACKNPVHKTWYFKLKHVKNQV